MLRGAQPPLLDQLLQELVHGLLVLLAQLGAVMSGGRWTLRSEPARDPRQDVGGKGMRGIPQIERPCPRRSGMIRRYWLASSSKQKAQSVLAPV